MIRIYFPLQHCEESNVQSFATLLSKFTQTPLIMHVSLSTFHNSVFHRDTLGFRLTRRNLCRIVAALLHAFLATCHCGSQASGTNRVRTYWFWQNCYSGTRSGRWFFASCWRLVTSRRDISFNYVHQSFIFASKVLFEYYNNCCFWKAKAETVKKGIENCNG